MDKSRARNEGGTGLGLSIVKHIIEAHGHNVQVRSTEGEGSTFFFTLTKFKLYMMKNIYKSGFILMVILLVSSCSKRDVQTQ